MEKENWDRQSISEIAAATIVPKVGIAVVNAVEPKAGDGIPTSNLTVIQHESHSPPLQLEDKKVKYVAWAVDPEEQKGLYLKITS